MGNFDVKDYLLGSPDIAQRKAIWKLVESKWAEVDRLQQPNLGEYMDELHFVDSVPMEIAQFESGGKMRHFEMRVSLYPNASPTHMDGYPPSDPVRFVSTVYLAYQWRPPTRGTAYSDVAGTLPDWSAAQKEIQMAVQLYHELIHGRLSLEYLPAWPASQRGILADFERWSAHAWSLASAADRASIEKLLVDLHGMIGDKANPRDEIEHFLQEKFAIQRAFGAFGVTVANTEIARQYAEVAYSKHGVPQSMRNLRAARAAQLATELTKFYDSLDRANAAKNIPNARTRSSAVEGSTPPATSDWRNLFAHPLTLPRMGGGFIRPPVQLRGFPWMQLRPPASFAPVSRFAPPLPRKPDMPVIRPMVSPPFPSYKPPPRIQPIQPSPYGIRSRFGGPGLAPFRGRFSAGASVQRPWQRVTPAPIRPGPGSGWNPEKAAFGGNRIDPAVTRMRIDLPSRPSAFPRPIFSGTRRMLDYGSRDFGQR